MKGITRKRINAKKGGPGGSGGSGTVTNISTTSPILGGPITVSGTISFDQSANFTWTGSHTFTVDLPTSSIVPTGADDFTNKAYVDAIAAGIIPAGTVLAATTAALPACTYANGALGVGATLTASAPGAFPAQDGVSFSTSDSLLVKNQASSLQNGQYILTDAGSGITPWILTRRTSYDTVSEILRGTATPVLAGTVNGGKVFWMVSPTPSTIGTDPITFDILFIPGGSAYTPGNGIDISGIIISARLSATGGLVFNAGQIAANPDGVTIDINGSNQLEFVGAGSDVTNDSLVAGATVTDALNTLSGSLVQNLTDVLTAGNTTSLTAIFDDGAGTALSVLPGGLDSTAGIRLHPTTAFSIFDPTEGLGMMVLDLTSGDWYLGDIGGYYGTPYIQSSGLQITLFTPNAGLTLDGTAGRTTISAGNGVSINNAYDIPIVDGTIGQTYITDGAGVVSWGVPTGYNTIIPLTAAALLVIAGNGALDPRVIYQIVDAGAGTSGVSAALNIVAQDSATLQIGGYGEFTNVNTRVTECKMTYDLTNNFILSVEEPLYNNKVYAGIRTSSALIEQSVIKYFDFDSANTRDNTINGCQFDNFSTGTELRGCTWNIAWVDFNSKVNTITNQYLDGVSNQLSGVPDMILGSNIELECNDFYGNDSEGTLLNMGDSAEISYVRIGWFSNVDMGNVDNADLRFCNIGSTAHIVVNTPSGVRYCEFGNGVNATLDGATQQCNFLSGDQGGIEILNFHGSRSTLINCDYSSGPDEITCNNSILNACSVNSTAGPAAGNLISNSNLTNCTIDFGVFTGCNVLGLTAENQIITFTGNNQTVGPVNMVHKYADATARNAAITLPLAGMTCVSGTKFSYYDGSSWHDL